MHRGTSLDGILEGLGIPRDLIASRNLRECPEAECLEIAEIGTDGRAHLLIPIAAAAWRGLREAALEDGIRIFIVSGFRSVERQAGIIRRKLEAGAGIEEIVSVCAPPGYSEHHSGRAVDVATPDCPALEAEFERTPAFRWLAMHTAGHGFRLSYPEGNPWGYLYEPWHWRFAGDE